MGFFNKIKTVLIGNIGTEDTAEKVAAENKDTNSINSHAALMKNIEKILNANYKGQKTSFSDKVLKIWVNDSLVHDSLKESGFITELICYLDNQMGVHFHSLEITSDPLPDQHNFTQVAANVYLQLCNRQVASISKRAEITVQENWGSLQKNRYILDSAEIETLPLKRYNIGFGEHPDISGMLRCNQIAIDDNQDSPEFNRNRYVSRTHAYIRYSDKSGFLLQAEREGTNLAGKRTRILRAEGVVEVDNFVAQPLKDGDCIELSKNVRLIFKLID